MSAKQEYLAAFVPEFRRRVPVNEQIGLRVARASWKVSPDGDPLEDAQTEASEWRASS